MIKARGDIHRHPFCPRKRWQAVRRAPARGVMLGMRAENQRRAEDAARRRGLLTVPVLARLGISRDAAERAVRAGSWRAPVRGGYVPYARPSTLVELAMQGATYVAQPCVLTGLIPLHLLGFRWLPDVTEAHLLVDDRVRRESQGPFVVQRTMCFDALESWPGAGRRFASVERAVVDAARRAGSLQDARGIVLGAVADRKAAVVALETVLGSCRRNGSALARRAIRDAARGCASPPEAELVDALLPLRRPFLVNPELWLDDVQLGSPDVWLLGSSVGGEVESAERHEGDAQTESTYDRHERFADAGVELVHLSVARIRRDAREAAAYYVARASAGPKPPPGLVVVPRGPILGARP